MKRNTKLISLAAALLLAPSLLLAKSAEDRKLGITGALGFPHILSGQVSYRITDRFALGVAYGGVPLMGSSTKSCGAVVSFQGYNVEGVARFHPFKGSFFLGGNLGYQDFRVNTVQKLGVPYEINDGIRSVYVTPHIGWYKVYSCGITIGSELGAQFPLSSKRYTDRVSGEGSYNPDAQDAVDKGLKILGKNVLPYITLIRLGYSF